MAGLNLSLLGGFQLTAGPDAAVVLPRKGRALLAFLALTPGHAQTRERLAGLLWEEAGEAQARTSLRQALSSIRKALPSRYADVLDADVEMISLAGNSVTMDVAQFERLLAVDTPPALEEASRLYRGDLLDGFNSGAPAFEDWVRAERERLRARARHTLSRLASHYAESDVLDSAVLAATRLVALDPLHEDGHRTLMGLYVRQGQPAEALRQYRRLREVLATELGVPPDPQTETLYRRILQERRLRPAPGALEEDVAGAESAAAASEAPATAAVRPAAVPPERCDATLLLADLYGFTAFIGQADPEEVHDFLLRYRAMASESVARFGGSLTNYIGARVMAVFGAPTAHGNDTERAVRASLALRQGARELRTASGERLAPHIGVASGVVLATVEGGMLTVTGEPVSIAARIMESGGPGEIRVSNRVRDALAERLDGQPLPGAEVKAVARPMEVWLVAGLRDAPARRALRPLVGRRLEIGQLTGLLDAVASSSRAHVLLVRGEAGIGKSRLIDELITVARDRGFTAYKSLLFDFGVDAASDPLRALARRLLEIREGADPTEQKHAVAHAMERYAFDDELRQPLYDLLDLPEEEALVEGVDPAARQRAQHDVLAELIELHTRARPLLLVLEDVHWASPVLLEQVARFVANLRACRGLLAMTTRTEGDPIGAAWRVQSAGCPITTIDLGPLSAQESLEMAAAYAPADEAFARSCVERAEGHPLFLDQLLRATGLERGGLPGSVRNLVLARLDRLAPTDKAALQSASVLGQRFTPEAVCFLLSDGGACDCARLIEQGLVRMEGDDYLFAHALIREAVYASLLRARRGELHARAAQYFATRDAGLHAEHLDAAQDASAAAAYLRASRTEMVHYQFRRALRLAERGLTLEAPPEVRHALLCLRGELLRDMGEVESAAVVFREALEHASASREKLAALLGLASALRILDRYDEALEVLREAEPLARELDDAAQLAELYFLRGNLYFPMGELDACLTAHETARDYALRAESPALEARALGSLGDAYYLRGDFHRAHEHFARCVELAHGRGMARVEVACLPMLGATQMYRNELELAAQSCQAAVDLARKVGSHRAELIAHDVLGQVRAYRGEWEGMRTSAERVLELARRLKARRFEADGLGILAVAVFQLGDRERAELLLDQAYGVSLEVGLKYTAAWGFGVVARVTTDPRKRERALAEGEKLLAQGCVSHNYLHFYENAIEAMLEAGNWSEARRYARALRDYVDGRSLPWSEFVVRRGDALARWGAGVRDAAIRGELAALRDEAQRCGLQAGLDKIEAALKA